MLGKVMCNGSKVGEETCLELILSLRFKGPSVIPQVQELLWELLVYFKELFSLADSLRGIVPPSLGDSQALRKKWVQRLSEVLTPLTTTYGLLILGQGLGNLHHMKCGRSLHSNSRLDSDNFENLYGVAELLVWIVFRRRDRNGIGHEIRRLFRGDLGQSTISTKTPLTKLMVRCTGLLHDAVPPMSIALRLDGAQILAPLHYVTVDGADTTEDHVGESQVVQGHGMGLIGSRRGDLNEYLEPPLPEDEDDDLSLG
ncbi:uncharacterized protein LOC143034419 [Oratosquilla oratoria]|uniref:uncharacterized protein LOC143034419 n=1 Tax=Oratosquilla oratoria TaxID=337810 RepID=UPI003F75CE45